MPRKPGPGRPKGLPNKMTVELKQALMAPFDEKKFKKWAESKPDLYFTQIVAKLLPKDINIRKIKRLADLTADELEALLVELKADIETEPQEKSRQDGEALH